MHQLATQTYIALGTDLSIDSLNMCLNGHILSKALSPQMCLSRFANNGHIEGGIL